MDARRTSATSPPARSFRPWQILEGEQAGAALNPSVIVGTDSACPYDAISARKASRGLEQMGERLGVKLLVSGGRSTLKIAYRILFLAAFWLVPVSAGNAETLRGVALVIGNSTYEHLSPLPNPANDARAVETLLNDLGFETSLSSDRDARRLARDLRDFVEDAEDADVAVVYYAGHGIEAGGENFLVPVDADLSALDAAGDRLVGVSPYLEQLQSTVPVVIVMLDACRDNPFPHGSMVRIDANAEPMLLSEGGLAETRGATRLTSRTSDVETYGTVLAFAAEPGRVALDGEPGGNSPYTSAILRHLDAMTSGEEFGTVMRMVAEEVYLKTAGAQRPWINENLRRLLYFGSAPDIGDGEVGEILAERRQLLVTIAALPDFERRQVERAAAQSGVPMDALFGMLRALGSDVPSDPAELERLLHAQTQRLREIVAEREALMSNDAEITRLAALAGEAIDEGALMTAIRLNERAKARVKELETTVADVEGEIRARRTEFAEVYVRSAEAYELAFNHLGAAEDYALAYDQVARWDEGLALRYKQAEMAALSYHGDHKGDALALERAIAAGRLSLRIAEGIGDRDGWAAAQTGLGVALVNLGEREGSTARLEEAVVAQRAALDVFTRENAPLNWAAAKNNLGIALKNLSKREVGTERLEEAVASFDAALQEYTPEEAPLQWAGVQNNLGNALAGLGTLRSNADWLEQAVEAYRAALEERTRERVPLDWAGTQNNLGIVLAHIGRQENSADRLEEAADAFRAALQEWTRERVPLRWAGAQASLAGALQRIGERGNDAEPLKEAVLAYRAALEEYSREDLPLQWAAMQTGLGETLQRLGEREDDAKPLDEAVIAFGAALEELTRERAPLQWLNIQSNLAFALVTLGELEESAERLEQSVEIFRGLLETYDRDNEPLDWAKASGNLGGALLKLGEQSGRVEDIEAARQSLIDSWDVYRAFGFDLYDDYFESRLSRADSLLAQMD